MNKYIIKTWLIVICLAMLTLVLTGCLPFGRAPGPGLIAYVGVDDNIYTIDPNGENKQALTSDAQSMPDQEGDIRVYQQPTWSPDGSRVAFVQVNVRGNRTQTAALFSVHPDGSDSAEIFNSAFQFPFYLYWSPDSQRLSFLTTGGLEPGLVLYMVDPQGGEAKLLETGQPFYWDWSPDSQTIVIHTGGSTRFNPAARLALLDLGDEITAEELSLQPDFFQAPAWSPDGEGLLLAAHTESDDRGLLLTDRDGEVLRVLRPGDDSIAFGWSPNGDWVAYVSEDGQEPDDNSRMLVYLDPAQPDEPHTVVQDVVIAFFWSPDSRKIAYFIPSSGIPSGQRVSMRRQESQFSLELYVHDVQTGDSQSLFEFTPTQDFLNILPFFDQYQRSATIWSPDSKNLVISAVDENEEAGIYAIDVSENLGARRLASGKLAFWSWR